MVTLLDEAHASGPSIVVRIAGTDAVEKPAVDLENDLKLAGGLARRIHSTGQRSQAPREAGCGLCKRALLRVLYPCLVPTQMRLVEQNAHELGHRQRVGCVSLS